MPSRASSPALIASAAVLDAALLLLFAALGRANHGGEGLWGLLGTWWPFLAGLSIGWLVMRAWRKPLGILWTGVGVWLVTVLAGMLLRIVSGQGVQTSFVVVTVLVVGAFLLGWRAVALLIRLRRPATR
jgi:hypothetical protein